MKDKITLVLRILTGLMFAVFGANKLVPFIPPPQPGEIPVAAAAFFAALMSNYILWYALGLMELGCGILLLIGKKVPLALILLAPIVANIFFFHLSYMAGLPFGIVTLGLEVYLLWQYKGHYDNFLKA